MSWGHNKQSVWWIQVHQYFLLLSKSYALLYIYILFSTQYYGTNMSKLVTSQGSRCMGFQCFVHIALSLVQQAAVILCWVIWHLQTTTELLINQTLNRILIGIDNRSPMQILCITNNTPKGNIFIGQTKDGATLQAKSYLFQIADVTRIILHNSNNYLSIEYLNK